MSDLKFDQILDEYVRFCNDSGKIDLNLYEEYNVKRGLRDSNGRGVLTGLTEVSDVMGFSVVDGHRVPIPGELYFQGYEVQQLVQGFRNSQYGFEETTYLLLFGDLPSQEQLDCFKEVLGELRQLPESFNRDVIMKAPSHDECPAEVCSDLIYLRSRSEQSGYQKCTDAVSAADRTVSGYGGVRLSGIQTLLS